MTNHGLSFILSLMLVPLASAFASTGASRGWITASPRGGGSLPETFLSSAPVTTEVEISATKGETGTTILAREDEFVRPLPDSRQYRAIRLKNNLEVLLVSSPESDVEAGAIHVQAGHMDDPESRPGLAHFHEHMLFLGTKKFPDENEYEAFLSSHGGSSNAFTDMQATNYYFSVTPHANDDEEEGCKKTSSALAGALDRLAQFFISPNFDTNMVEREMRAIDSEYKNSLMSDSWRNYQLLKSSANPDHPFSKFGCGNYETLTNADSEDGSSLPYHDLVDFWKTYYQTFNMRLCVVGQSDLDSLQQTVEETFGALPASTGIPRRSKRNSGALFPMEHAEYGQIAFGKDQLGTMREVIPLMESRVIRIHFATPPSIDPTLKHSRPYRVFSHLLGHESPGSLHALLNEEGLLTGLSSGVGVDASDFSLFSLTLGLTPKGMAQRDLVLDLVFQWITLIQQTPPEALKLYHEELQQISRNNFMFRESGDPTDFCSAAAELLFEYEPSQILVGSSIAGEYDNEVAQEFSKRLKPENAMITIMNSDLVDKEGEWETERWYGATYRQWKMPRELTEKWTKQEIDSRLELPALNAYIPNDFSLRCDDDEGKDLDSAFALEKGRTPPNLLVERPDMRLWHKLDRKWRVPKTALRLSLLSPNVYRSPRTMTLNRIYQRVLNDELNSFVYDANVAGCNYRVSCVPNGYRVSITGYSQKLPFLFDILTSRMLSLIQEMKEGPEAHHGLAQKFNKALESLLRETKNYRLDSPHEVASYNSRLLLEEDVWYLDNYIDEMEGVLAERHPLTMRECARVAEESLGQVKAEVLCMGNVNEEGALEVAEVVESHFLRPSRPLSEVETPSFKSLQLPTRSEAIKIFGPEVTEASIPVIQQEVAFSATEENNAVEVIFQVGCDLDLGYEGVAILDLVTHIAYNSAFSQLRTKEQLGYLVSCFTRKTVGTSWGISVLVQSSVATPAKLEERIEEWLKTFRRELEEMTPQSIAMEAGAVVAQLLERDTKLSQEAGHLWGAIASTETLGSLMKTPAFDRLERIADELAVYNDDAALPSKTPEELKEALLDFFDRHLAADSEHRRAMAARVYSQEHKTEFDENVGKPGVLSNYDDIRHLKQFLPSWPIAPYWRKERR